jgi:hypothetical protein
MNQPSLKLWRASCRLTRIGFATLGLVHLSAFFALFLTYEALAKWIRGYSGFKCLFLAPLRLCVRFWLCRPSSAFLQTIPELRHFFRRLPSSFFLHAFCIAVLALFIEWLRRRVRKVSDANPALQRAVPILDLPVSTAFVLSALLVPTLYLQAPRWIQVSLAAVALIPTVLLILRRLLQRNLFPLLYALIGLFLVGNLRVITASLPVIARFSFFGADAGWILFSDLVGS